MNETTCTNRLSDKRFHKKMSCLQARKGVHLQAVYILTFLLVHLHQEGDFKIKISKGSLLNRFIDAIRKVYYSLPNVCTTSFEQRKLKCSYFIFRAMNNSVFFLEQ